MRNHRAKIVDRLGTVRNGERDSRGVLLKTEGEKMIVAVENAMGAIDEQHYLRGLRKLRGLVDQLNDHNVCSTWDRSVEIEENTLKRHTLSYFETLVQFNGS